MDKNILKKFAIESRQDLMQKMDSKIKSYYVDEEFNKSQNGDIIVLSNDKHSLSLSKEEFDKRETLIKRINELGLDQVIEESAYTWFNRIVAIRYMEIHDYLPLTKDNQSLGIRVLSSKDNTLDPEILKFTNLVNPDLDINFKKEKFNELKDENEKFKYILLLICKKLGKVIPQVFDGITDYIDILIPDNLLNDTGFVHKIIAEIPESNYNHVEIIGWLYQYYNQTEKERVISTKNVYKKNEIPYATQLFTPDWIVKYMVENSLGRYWIEHGGDKKLIDNWIFFVKENIKSTSTMIKPSDIKCIDPCSGSGHILVYMFEVLYQIYESYGYSRNDIAIQILKNNIYGLDIDDRAGQLSILSILLKAREYDKNIFDKNVAEYINVMSIQESTNIELALETMNLSESCTELFKEACIYTKDAKEIGSLLIVPQRDYTELKTEINNDNTIFSYSLKQKLFPLLKELEILSQKYDVVVTNPPYLNNSVMSDLIKDYLNQYYCNAKTDLFAAFINKCNNLLNINGYSGIVTMQSWMFLPSFIDFRKNIIDNYDIPTLIYMDNGVMGIAFGTCATIFKNKEQNNIQGYYYEIKYSNLLNDKPVKFPIRENKNNIVDINMFKELPNYNFSYWLNKNEVDIFKNKNISEYGEAKQGIATGDNDRFMRFWYEINFANSSINKNEIEPYKWVPYNKGGTARKWYGNYDYVVNWENDGYEIKHFYNDKGKLRSRPQNLNYLFKPSITWSLTNSTKFCVRYRKDGSISDINGMGLYVNNTKYLNYIMGYMNTSLVFNLIKVINPTMANQAGDIIKLPVILNEEKLKDIDKIVEKNIEISKNDWDSFETSWDFIRHPLLTEATLSPHQIREEENSGFMVCNNMEEAYKHWKLSCERKFKEIKTNEEELNSIFLNIYELQSEFTPDESDRDVTIHKIYDNKNDVSSEMRTSQYILTKQDVIKSFISYAVGCMFGRYSLDENGLIYAGGKFDENKYKIFKADSDNIIPITDDAYFADDIVDRFKKFVEVVYGKQTLNENIDFIAEALGKKGTETSEETIRRYFLNDFYTDHLKTYQKRPIYWLFDSGKKNGFKALIYMHRYNENTVPKIRLDYLHRMQTTYDKLLSDINYKLTTELSMSDKKAVQNKQADLNAKLQEINEYDEKIAHIANQRISIDLDDGVKVNYDKFKDILAKIK